MARPVLRATRYSSGVFAIAVASLAVLGVVHGEPAPAWLGGAAAWWPPAHQLAALATIAACAALLHPRTQLAGGLVIIACQAVRALLQIPSIVAAPLALGSWYGFSEASSPLAAAGILTLAARPASPLHAGGIRAAQVAFGLTCAFYGCSHYAYADLTAAMVPGWLPAHGPLAGFTGLAHLAAGVGIATGIRARLAATLEALMMGLFGLLVWVPTFWANPPPPWAMDAATRWSELVITFMLAASALVVAESLGGWSWRRGTGAPR